MKKSWIPESLQVTTIAMVVFLLYAIGMMYPDTWWGLHYPVFLGGGKGWFIILVAIGFTLYSQKYNPWKSFQDKNIGGNSWIWIIAITVLAGMLFYQMPIYKDVYGDALKIIPSTDYIVTDFTAKNKEMVTSFDLTNLKLGTDTTLGIIAWLAYTKEMPLGEAFRLLTAVCGMGYVFFMLATVFRLAKDSQQKILFALLTIGTPITMNFCGHIEVYAPVLFMLAAFWYGMVRLLETPNWKTGVIVFVMCVLNVKFHISGLLTFFVFGVALLVLYHQRKEKKITWRKEGTWVIGFFFAIGFFVYAFVTKSIFGTRSYTEENLTDAIFLPMKASNAAPLDRYNLFSWNHFFDYFNMVFGWSAIALVVIGAALLFKRKSIQWNQPLVMISGMGFLFYFVTFFVLNPLLSMQTDWDLMSIPAVVLIIFAVAVVSATKQEKKEERTLSSYLIAPAIGLALIAVTGIFVNANQESLSKRLFSMGKYSYKTYWIGASTPITEAIKLQESNDDKYEMLQEAVNELQPYAVYGNDIEYAALLNMMGNYHRDVHKDYNEAYRWYLKSEKADKHLLENIRCLTYTYMIREEYTEANKYVNNLVFNNYPDEVTALRLGIRMSVEVGEYDRATEYCEKLLNVKPDDAFTQNILHLLNTAEDKSKIKLNYR
ncbi:MAG: tetratricopeptide repeat protein [Fluviicola sp.]